MTDQGHWHIYEMSIFLHYLTFLILLKRREDGDELIFKFYFLKNINLEIEYTHAFVGVFFSQLRFFKKYKDMLFHVP